MVELQLSQRRRRPALARIWAMYRQNLFGMLGLGMLLVIIAAALLAPQLAPFKPTELTSDLLVGPSRAHPLGTDHLGRDILSEVLYGSRVSLTVGFVSAAISAVVGTFLGAVAGFWGGWIDIVISRVIDVFLMVPTFFLILIVVVLFGSGLGYVMTVIGLTIWPANARLMRAEALTLRERTFVRASQALGESRWRILIKHIIPNGIYPVIANTSLQMAGAILTEAGLSFVGLGDPNMVSWGQMIYEGRSYLQVAWWASLFPGLALIITVLAFYFIGDGLGYALNPRLKEERG